MEIEKKSTKIKCKGSQQKGWNRPARTKLQAIIWKFKSKALKTENSRNKPVCAVTIKCLCVCTTITKRKRFQLVIHVAKYSHIKADTFIAIDIFHRRNGGKKTVPLV